MVDVSVIIVNYNTCKMTLDCLESIYKYTEGISFEVIISDNASVDDSTKRISEKYTDVLILKNEKNLGFGAANNRAIDVASGKYLFFLNSDTLLLNNAIKIFFDYWENSKEDLGALGAHLIGTDGQYTHSFGEYPNYKSTYFFLMKAIGSSLIGRFKKPTTEKQNIHVMDMATNGYITGADLFLKNENIKFDERFFMYSEEVDLQYNLFLNTSKIRYVLKEPQIIHLEGGSDSEKDHTWYDFRRKSSIYYWISRLKYLKKNVNKPIGLIGLKVVIMIVWMLPSNNSATRPYRRELIKA